jgi:hypothetical protein
MIQTLTIPFKAWANDSMPSQMPALAGAPYGQMLPQTMAPNTYANEYTNGQGQHSQLQSQGGNSPNMGDESDELIPTAIVIKNIPFAVKKEQLQDIMTSLGLPVPYAFNYHFDNGVFRGLAFANFSSAEDTKIIIREMNHMDLQGRKLRVEYKKMLPIQERERIEREKRERRGQLEEQHRPQAMTLHNQTSMSSMSSQPIMPRGSPSPVSTRGPKTGNKVLQGGFTGTTHQDFELTILDVDMNDPATLGYYSELLKFKDSESKVIQFDAPLPPEQRKVLHTLAQHLGLQHHSMGDGDARFMQITKTKMMMPQAQNTQLINNTIYDERRSLTRAATTEFGAGRANESFYPSLRGQSSANLNVPRSPGGDSGLNRANNLRGAKSFGDLQAGRSASPALSLNGGFPAGLAQNASRYANDYNGINGGLGSADLAPTPTTSGYSAGREDAFLNGFGNMSIYDRPNGQARSAATNGAIGSQRSLQTLNGNYDEQPRNGGVTAAPERQPQGPGSDWGRGFTARPRQNGHGARGSDELDQYQLDQANDRTGGGQKSRFM